MGGGSEEGNRKGAAHVQELNSETALPVICVALHNATARSGRSSPTGHRT